MFQLPAIEFCYIFVFCIVEPLIKVLFARRYFQCERQSFTHTGKHVCPHLKFLFYLFDSRFKTSRRHVFKSFNHSPGFSPNFLLFQLPERALHSSSACICPKMVLLPSFTQDFLVYTFKSSFWEPTCCLLCTTNIQIFLRVVIWWANISQMDSIVSAGQLSSATATLSLPLSQRKRKRKYNERRLRDEIRIGRSPTSYCHGQNRFSVRRLI